MKSNEFCMAVALILFVAVVWIVVQDATHSKRKSTHNTPSTCDGTCEEEGEEEVLMGEKKKTASVMARASKTSKKKGKKEAPVKEVTPTAATPDTDGPMPFDGPTAAERKKGIHKGAVTDLTGSMDEPRGNIGTPGMMDAVKGYATCGDASAPKRTMPASLYVFGAPSHLPVEYVNQKECTDVSSTPPYQ